MRGVFGLAAAAASAYLSWKAEIKRVMETLSPKAEALGKEFFRLSRERNPWRHPCSKALENVYRRTLIPFKCGKID
jgi:hypothetical protein